MVSQPIMTAGLGLWRHCNNLSLDAGGRPDPGPERIEKDLRDVPDILALWFPPGYQRRRKASHEVNIVRAGPRDNTVKRTPPGFVTFRERIDGEEPVDGHSRQGQGSLGMTPRRKRKVIQIARYGYAGISEVPVQRGKGGQRQNDVAQGTGMEDEYLHYSMIMALWRVLLAILT
jgi:hypothetical protein